MTITIVKGVGRGVQRGWFRFPFLSRLRWLPVFTPNISLNVCNIFTWKWDPSFLNRFSHCY